VATPRVVGDPREAGAVILLSSAAPYHDRFSFGNFADRVIRRWGHLGIYLDRLEPRDTRSHVGPDRWRLESDHRIVAEHTGGIIPEARPGQVMTWDIAWLAEDEGEFLRADASLPRPRRLSTGLIGDGMDARKVRPDSTQPLFDPSPGASRPSPARSGAASREAPRGILRPRNFFSERRPHGRGGCALAV
jgi:hypothetical protein